MSERRGLLVIAVGAAGILLLAGAVLFRSAGPEFSWRRGAKPSGRAGSAPEPVPAGHVADALGRPRPVVRPDLQGRALHDATLANQIRIAKVALRKGDWATRDAMLVGLRRNSVRSRELVSEAISKATDPEDHRALGDLLGELP